MAYVGNSAAKLGHTVRITSEGDGPNRTKIEIDGKEFTGVRSFSLSCDSPSSPKTMTLTFFVSDIDVHKPCEDVSPT